LLGGLIRQLGTDPNRRFGEMAKIIPEAIIVIDESAMLHGQYRVILLEKPNISS